MIEVAGLSKSFGGPWGKRFEAVRDLTFSVQPGTIFGLLGPNGAGKTTALRIISTAIRATTGTGCVCGFDLARKPDEIRRRLGFVGAGTGVYGRLTPREVLQYFARLNGLSTSEFRTRLEAVDTWFSLAAFMDRACDKLSTGMKQRVNLARAVLHDPPILILDEPTTGLDLLAAESIVEFIEGQKRAGRTIILSTHIASEMERLCDHLGVMREGSLVFTGDIPALRAHGSGNVQRGLISLLRNEPNP